MTENIPAWKKLGLKVQSKSEENIHIKRTSDAADINSTKKPSKRVKLPKKERPPPPESDNIKYLKEYQTNKENWKFSKQKQNWILKHLYQIEQIHEQALLEYLKGMMGASRERVIEQSRENVEKWNEFMSHKEEENRTEEEKSEIKTGSDKPVAILETTAKRAQSILEKMTGKKLSLLFIDEFPDEKEKETSEEGLDDKMNLAKETEDQSTENQKKEKKKQKKIKIREEDSEKKKREEQEEKNEKTTKDDKKTDKKSTKTGKKHGKKSIEHSE